MPGGLHRGLYVFGSAYDGEKIIFDADEIIKYLNIVECKDINENMLRNLLFQASLESDPKPPTAHDKDNTRFEGCSINGSSESDHIRKLQRSMKNSKQLCDECMNKMRGCEFKDFPQEVIKDGLDFCAYVISRLPRLQVAHFIYNDEFKDERKGLSKPFKKHYF